MIVVGPQVHVVLTSDTKYRLSIFQASLLILSQDFAIQSQIYLF